MRTRAQTRDANLQERHSVWPVAGWYEPGAHRGQEAEPRFSENEPASQSVHEPAPAREKVPATHCRQEAGSVLPAVSEYVPPMHAVQPPASGVPGFVTEP
jgi:hypothetical protein